MTIPSDTPEVVENNNKKKNKNYRFKLKMLKMFFFWSKYLTLIKDISSSTQAVVESTL